MEGPEGSSREAPRWYLRRGDDTAAFLQVFVFSSGRLRSHLLRSTTNTAATNPDFKLAANQAENDPTKAPQLPLYKAIRSRNCLLLVPRCCW
ncbi:uncharacterized protein LOC121988974 isoform X2 [Zingiber officinale]|uniref:uncharacterized protein LOC121988974 isoform X2 n=1 Tax=Zingiber officinale TaxID=94328 RepID=UPI001C4B2C32|nr:uncharacterized protein LOC121988974 isoform X2 [Zingiber officinale]